LSSFFFCFGCAEEGRKITELNRQVEVEKEGKVESLKVNSVYDIKAKIRSSALYLNSGKLL